MGDAALGRAQILSRPREGAVATVRRSRSGTPATQFTSQPISNCRHVSEPAHIAALSSKWPLPAMLEEFRQLDCNQIGGVLGVEALTMNRVTIERLSVPSKE